VPPLKQIQMTDDEKGALQFAADKLATVLGASEKFVADVVEPPVPGSRIDLAYKADLRDAYDAANLLILAAEDHLRTILQVVRDGPLPTFALYTLLRAAAEAVVRCRHMLDPGISEPVRLGRALNERLDNLQEQNKVKPETQGSHLPDRVVNLEKRASENGISVVRSQPKGGSVGKVLGFGETVKSEVELFEAYLPAGSTAFRFLSGYVHSKPWVQIPRHRAERSKDSAIAMVPTDLNVVLFAGVLDLVVTLHDENIGFWHTLAGLPGDVWRSAKGAA
jgi:hypothetical protein